MRLDSSLIKEILLRVEELPVDDIPELSTLWNSLDFHRFRMDNK